MLCYVDPNGNKEILFGSCLKKRGVERAIVESKIQENSAIRKPENPNHNLVFWDDNTYVDDKCVRTHDDDYDIVTCVGEWNPKAREVVLDN